MGERGAAVKCAVTVICENWPDCMTQEELELQLDAIWKSGYQAGRKAARKTVSSKICSAMKSVENSR